MRRTLTRKHLGIGMRIAILVTGLILTIGIGRSFAQQPATLESIGSGDTTLLSSGWTMLETAEEAVYPFDVIGEDAVVSVWMNVAVPDAATFEVWDGETYLARNEPDTDAAPVGVGSALPSTPGFLTWQGTFEEAGSYVVLVTAAEDALSQYLLNVGGPGVAVPPAPPENIALSLPSLLNVRQGPSTAYAVITTVEQGTTLLVTGRNPLNTWIQVELPDGTIGWVTRSLTNYVGVAELIEAPPLDVAIPADDAETDVADEADTDTDADDTDTDATGEEVVDDETLPVGDTNLEQPEARESLSGNWRLLDPGAVEWYTFDHTGGDRPVHVWMDTVDIQNAGFAVYDPAAAEAILAGASMEDFTPIGRGTSNPAEPGYLFWRGTFEEAGDFFILVSHDTPNTLRYSIYAAGPGLARATPE